LAVNSFNDWASQMKNFLCRALRENYTWKVQPLYFDFRKTHFDSRRAGALPSCANVCKRPKTDFLRGASGSTSEFYHLIDLLFEFSPLTLIATYR
jgi:hypothetical protein